MKDVHESENNCRVLSLSVHWLDLLWFLGFMSFDLFSVLISFHVSELHGETKTRCVRTPHLRAFPHHPRNNEFWQCLRSAEITNFVAGIHLPPPLRALLLFVLRGKVTYHDTQSLVIKPLVSPVVFRRFNHKLIIQWQCSTGSWLNWRWRLSFVFSAKQLSFAFLKKQWGSLHWNLLSTVLCFCSRTTENVCSMWTKSCWFDCLAESENQKV